MIGLADGYYEAGGGTGARAQGGQAGVSGEQSLGGGTVAGDQGQGGTTTGDGGSGGLPNAGSSGSGGVSNVLQIPAGKLVFQRFTSYDAGDSQMFVVKFPEATMGKEIGATYGLCAPYNGIFSPDGTHLVVAATLRGGSGTCPVLDRNQLELFILDLDNPPNKQQVTSNGIPDEDPQYSPTGDAILFKHNGYLARWVVRNTTFVETCANPMGSYCFHHSGPEQSKPVTDGTQVCYANSYDNDTDIYCFDLTAGLTGVDISLDANRMLAAGIGNISESRPVVAKAAANAPPWLYYTRWRSVANPVNQILRKPMNALQGPAVAAQFCSEEAASCADPYGLDDHDTVVFSSNTTGHGGSDLFIGNFSQPDIKSLDEWLPGVNTPNQELGATFWAAP